MNKMATSRLDVKNCVNCGKLLGERKVTRLNVASRLQCIIRGKTLKSVKSVINVEAVVAENVAVYEALDTIFKLGEDDLDVEAVGGRELLAVCQMCSLVLHDLFRSYREFGELRERSSYLGGRIGDARRVAGKGRRTADRETDGEVEDVPCASQGSRDSGVGIMALEEIKVEVEGIGPEESISRRDWEEYSHLYSTQVVGRSAVSPLQKRKNPGRKRESRRMKRVPGGNGAKEPKKKERQGRGPKKVRKEVGDAPKPTLSLQQPERTESLPDVNVLKKKIPSNRKKNLSQKSLRQRQPKIELCDECRKTFVNTRYLKLHKLGRHEEAYECSRCQISVPENMLQLHYAKYHEGKAVVRFSCGSCTYTTHTATNIKAHISRIHTFEQVKIKTEM